MSIITSIGPEESGHACVILRGSEAICGLREVSDHSQILRVCAFPFAEIGRYCGLPVLHTAGCYILAAPHQAYIGETKDLGDRLRTHAQDCDKAFAREVFIITAFDDGRFDKQAARYFQFRLTHEAEARNLVRIVKGANPPQPCLPLDRVVSFNRMLAGGWRLLFDAGCRVFHASDPAASLPPAPPMIPSDHFDEFDMMRVECGRVPADAEEYELEYVDVWARGYQPAEDAEGLFVVLCGSYMRAELNNSANKIFASRRKKLIESGAVVPVATNPELYRFTVSVAFRSAAVAAKVVCGAHVHGGHWNRSGVASLAPGALS